MQQKPHAKVAAPRGRNLSESTTDGRGFFCIHPYCNQANLCFPGKESAARKHKEKKLCLKFFALFAFSCGPSSVVAAQAALGPSESICGFRSLSFSRGWRVSRFELPLRFYHKPPKETKRSKCTSLGIGSSFSLLSSVGKRERERLSRHNLRLIGEADPQGSASLFLNAEPARLRPA